MASALARCASTSARRTVSEIRVYSTAFMLYLAGVLRLVRLDHLPRQRRRFAFGRWSKGLSCSVPAPDQSDAFIRAHNLARPPR